VLFEECVQELVLVVSAVSVWVLISVAMKNVEPKSLSYGKKKSVFSELEYKNGVGSK